VLSVVMVMLLWLVFALWPERWLFAQISCRWRIEICFWSSGADSSRTKHAAR